MNGNRQFHLGGRQRLHSLGEIDIDRHIYLYIDIHYIAKLVQGIGLLQALHIWMIILLGSGSQVVYHQTKNHQGFGHWSPRKHPCETKQNYTIRDLEREFWAFWDVYDFVNQLHSPVSIISTGSSPQKHTTPTIWLSKTKFLKVLLFPSRIEWDRIPTDP